VIVYRVDYVEGGVSYFANALDAKLFAEDFMGKVGEVEVHEFYRHGITRLSPAGKSDPGAETYGRHAKAPTDGRHVIDRMGEYFICRDLGELCAGPWESANGYVNHITREMTSEV
jgi:hypothetical protein